MLLAAMAATPLLSRSATAAPAGDGERVDVDGFSFVVPPGWRRVQPGRAEGSITHIGLWLQGRYSSQAFIALDEDMYPGRSLTDFALATENAMRSRLSKVFVDARDKLQMPNGMPALRMKVEYLAGDSDALLQQYVWLIYDGRIGIALSIGGGVGRISLEEASKIASTLTVVWRGDGPPPPL